MKISRINLLLIGLIGIHLFLLINLQFTAWPEMSSFPYLFSKGFTIYKDFVHPYPPFLTVILAGIYQVFGYKLIVLKLFTWVFIVVNDVLIYQIVKRFSKNEIAPILSLIFYILTQPFLDGNMLWFDTALVTPLLAGTYFAVRDFETGKKSGKNLFISGIFFAIALLTKQTVMVFIAFLIFVTLMFQKKIKSVFMFISPIIISIGLLLIWIFSTQSLSYFLNWNFIFPAKYWTVFPGYVRLMLTIQEWRILFLLMVPALVLITLKFKEIVSNKIFLVIYLFLLAGVISVYPRFSFFHFQSALAFCAIIFGIYYTKLIPPVYLVSIYFVVLLTMVSLPGIKTNWNKETRFWSTADIKFVNLISTELGEGSIYLLGPHSSYYVISGSLPPKPWLDNFGWFFEVPGVQEDTINRWKENPPDSILVQDAALGNWYELGTYRPKLILSWIETNYTKMHQVVPGVWYWKLKQ